MTAKLTITLAQRINYDKVTTGIEVRGAPMRGNYCAQLTQLLQQDRATVEPAGPGWGGHNAVLQVAYDEVLGDAAYEHLSGSYLVTIRER